MKTSVELRVYVPGDVAAPDVLGLWQAAPGAEGRSVWEVDITDSRQPQRTVLQETAARVADAGRAMAEADARLQRFLDQSAGPGLSFGAAEAGLREPERRLASAVAPQAQAFFLGDLREELAQAAEQASAFARQVQGAVGQPVVVRSRARGRALGVTGVSWTGDATTAWARGTPPEDAALHRQAVQLALGTFRGWLRIALLAGAGAAKLALLLPSGAGVLAALPAVWRFVTEVLEEQRRLRLRG